jgi:hypothetical protein
MEAVFTLPYPEYVVAEELSKHLRKGDAYSVCVPVSRQQKGIDMLVYNMKTGRSATIQVKSSRAYLGHQKKRDPLAEVFDFHLWFNALDPASTSSNFYAFIGLYPKRTIISHRLSHSQDPKKWWAHIILLLPGPEVSRLMENIRIRGERFFYVSFNNDLKRVVLSRGLAKTQEWTPYLLNKSVFGIADFLKR